MFEARTVKVDREQVTELMGCDWQEVRARIRNGAARDPHSGAVVHSPILGVFKNGARLVHRKGAAGHEFFIMPKTINGAEAQEIQELLEAGQSIRLNTDVSVHNGGTA